MRDHPFPGPNDDPHPRYYTGPDYDENDLESWLGVLDRAGWLRNVFDSMTYSDYILMRSARLTMMRTMLIYIPGVFPSFPALWYTFDNMGHLLDSLNTWPRPLIGQMAAVNDFFNNPQWLPMNH